MIEQEVRYQDAERAAWAATGVAAGALVVILIVAVTVTNLVIALSVICVTAAAAVVNFKCKLSRLEKAAAALDTAKGVVAGTIVTETEQLGERSDISAVEALRESQRRTRRPGGADE